MNKHCYSEIPVLEYFLEIRNFGKSRNFRKIRNFENEENFRDFGKLWEFRNLVRKLFGKFRVFIKPLCADVHM
jgi:hypothetical protein